MMKERIPFLLAAGMIPLATAALGQDSSSRAYVTTDLGAAFEQSVRIHNSTDLIDFHNGVRGDIAVGYQANSWFAAEFATGVIWNSADKIGGVRLASFGSSLDLYQFPIMGNVIVSTPAWHGFKPYIGVGVGTVAAMLDFRQPLGNIHDTDFTLSYQALVGVNYQICKHVDLGIGYKFLQTDVHSWAENGVTFRTAGTATHSVTASLTWKF